MKQVFLIDGYNLLFAMGVLNGQVGPQGLEKARGVLLEMLTGLAGRATVVFDAARTPRGSQAEQDVHGIKVLFAKDWIEADDLIEAIIAQQINPKYLAVVSNDHRLQRAARRREAQAMGCDEFLDLLERPGEVSQTAAPPPLSRDKEQPLSPEETARWLKEFPDLQKELDRAERAQMPAKLPPSVPARGEKKPPSP